MAVCGDQERRHGIVLTKNPLAKKAGIQTGEVIWQAKQKCPGLVLIPADQRKYLLYSRRMREVVDFPTATDPATPMTKGVRWRRSMRKSLVTPCNCSTASQ